MLGTTHNIIALCTQLYTNLADGVISHVVMMSHENALYVYPCAIFVYVNIYMHVHVYTCKYIYTMYIHVDIYMYMYMYVRILYMYMLYLYNAHVSSYSLCHTCTHTYMYIYMYTCIHSLQLNLALTHVLQALHSKPLSLECCRVYLILPAYFLQPTNIQLFSVFANTLANIGAEWKAVVGE